MKTRVKLRPGQNGTKMLHRQYGDALVCVRYRYDEKRRKQLKTVEIIVSEKAWTPQAKYPESTIVSLKIGVTEKSLQKEVKALGGRWSPEQKAWLVPYGCIVGTKLEKLIIVETQRGAEEQECL